MVTLLTPDQGKLKVLAKGARKISSRKAGHIELFTRTQLLLAKGKTFDLITQAELVETFLPLRDDIVRGSSAHYLCELIERFAQDEQSDPALYNLLVEALHWLAHAQDPALAIRYFEMRLLVLSGYRPQLHRCVLTGQALPVDLQTADAPISRGTPFSPADGGVLAPDALKKVQEWLTLTHSGLMMLRAFQREPYESLDALALPPELHSELERVLQANLSYVLEGRSRAFQLVKQMQKS